MKKYFKSYILFALMALTFAGCKTDDLKDDLNDLKDRVTLLEEQVKILNDNLEVISYLFNEKIVITSCTPNGTAPDYTSYTIKFSDNTELELNLGSESSVRLPDMEIVEGKWVIEGVKTEVPVSNDTPGSDGLVPKFELVKDETDNKYYYTVQYGEEEPKPVTDAEGNKIYVTIDDKLPEDPDFVTAKMSDDGKYFELTLKKEPQQTKKVPIVSDLSCSIINPFGGKSLDLVPDANFSLKVQIKGDDYFVNAPKGWQAVISALDENGIATINVSSTGSTVAGRAVADNSKDLSVMVNKDNYWAVDKLQLNVIEEAQASDAVKYFSGKQITINGVDIDKNNFGAPMIVSENVSIVETDKEKYQVFFIGAGKTLTVNPQVYDNNGKPGYRQYTGENLVFLSMDKSNPGTVKFADQGFIGISMLKENTNAYILAKDVIFDTTESNKYMITPLKKTKELNVEFNSCKLKMADQPITYLNSANYYDSFKVEDCDIEYTGNKTTLNFFNLGTGAEDLGDIVFKNNLIYCKSGYKLQYKILNAASTAVGNIDFQNNTIVNIEPRATGLFNITSAKSIVFKNNLLWSDAQLNTGGNFITVFKDATPETLTGSATDNIYFSPTNFNLFIDGKLFTGFDEITKVDTDPFTGGTFDLANGKFVPNDTYKQYGATRN